MTRAAAKPARARLYVDAPLAAGRDIALARPPGHYLANVLRLGVGDEVLLFNGRDGEWAAKIVQASRKQVALSCREETRAQTPGGDLGYYFAPLKHARLDYMVQKATELGAARLAPVFTTYTVPARVNLDRMRANAIEAAEQCNLLTVPEVAEPAKLDAVLANWPENRLLIHCDEAAPRASPLAALKDIAAAPADVLIGPEGGFSPQERETLRGFSFVRPIALGPRIMRADTAAIAALALVQAALGDWR